MNTVVDIRELNGEDNDDNKNGTQAIDIVNNMK